MSKAPDHTVFEYLHLEEDEYAETETKKIMAKIDKVKTEMWLLGYKFKNVERTSDSEMRLIFVPCDCQYHFVEERENPN